MKDSDVEYLIKMGTASLCGGAFLVECPKYETDIANATKEWDYSVFMLRDMIICMFKAFRLQSSF